MKEKFIQAVEEEIRNLEESTDGDLPIYVENGLNTTIPKIRSTLINVYKESINKVKEDKLSFSHPLRMGRKESEDNSITFHLIVNDIRNEIVLIFDPNSKFKKNKKVGKGGFSKVRKSFCFSPSTGLSPYVTYTPRFAKKEQKKIQEKQENIEIYRRLSNEVLPQLQQNPFVIPYFSGEKYQKQNISKTPFFSPLLSGDLNDLKKEYREDYDNDNYVIACNLFIIYCISLGVCGIHKSGALHRDLKLINILYLMRNLNDLEVPLPLIGDLGLACKASNTEACKDYIGTPSLFGFDHPLFNEWIEKINSFILKSNNQTRGNGFSSLQEKKKEKSELDRGLRQLSRTEDYSFIAQILITKLIKKELIPVQELPRDAKEDAFALYKLIYDLMNISKKGVSLQSNSRNVIFDRIKKLCYREMEKGREQRASVESFFNAFLAELQDILKHYPILAKMCRKVFDASVIYGLENPIDKDCNVRNLTQDFYEMIALKSEEKKSEVKSTKPSHGLDGSVFNVKLVQVAGAVFKVRLNEYGLSESQVKEIVAELERGEVAHLLKSMSQQKSAKKLIISEKDNFEFYSKTLPNYMNLVREDVNIKNIEKVLDYSREVMTKIERNYKTRNRLFDSGVGQARLQSLKNFFDPNQDSKTSTAQLIQQAAAFAQIIKYGTLMADAEKRWRFFGYNTSGYDSASLRMTVVKALNLPYAEYWQIPDYEELLAEILYQLKMQVLLNNFFQKDINIEDFGDIAEDCIEENAFLIQFCMDHENRKGQNAKMWLLKHAYFASIKKNLAQKQPLPIFRKNDLLLVFIIKYAANECAKENPSQKKELEKILTFFQIKRIPVNMRTSCGLCHESPNVLQILGDKLNQMMSILMPNGNFSLEQRKTSTAPVRKRVLFLTHRKESAQNRASFFPSQTRPSRAYNRGQSRRPSGRS